MNSFKPMKKITREEKIRKLDLKDELGAFQRRLNQKKPYSKKQMKDFENRLNEDRSNMPQKKKPKKIKLEKRADEESPMYAKLKKELRTPLKMSIDGKKYTRSCTEGSMGAETLVRLNIETLVRQAKEIGKKAIAEKDDRMLFDLCLDPMYGMNRANFTDTRNNTMNGAGRAVQELIKQFFKDAPMMEKLKKDITNEFYSDRWNARQSKK